MSMLIFYLLLALILSFICSIMEAVLLTTPVSFLKVRFEKGLHIARKIIELKKHIDKPLSAILTLNTIAHTVGAAGVGAEATKLFGDAYFGIVSAVMTILILVFTEIIPKTIGARYWRELAMIAGYTIMAMIFITYPFVHASSFITKLFSKSKKDQTTSREEISALAKIGLEEGVIGEKENKIIQNLIKLSNIQAFEVATPRTVVSIADENMLLTEFLKRKEYLHFSRIPIYSGDSEHITGYVFRQIVFEKLAEDKLNLKLKDIKRDIIVISDDMPLLDIWELLLDRKEHIALVLDEYGSMEGIITMEDIIETLLGFEIIDEKDRISDMQQYARDRWQMRQTKYNLIESASSNNFPENAI